MSNEYVTNLEMLPTKDITDNHINGSLTVIWRDWDNILKNHPKMDQYKIVFSAFLIVLHEFQQQMMLL